MASYAVCLDSNQNTIACSDPDCTFGDCGSTDVQRVSGSLCLDSAQNTVACSDSECIYGDCSPNSSGQIGLAISSHDAAGGTSLSTPANGGSIGGITPLINSISNAITAGSKVFTAPPKTSFSLGASGLNISSAGSLFSNPLMLLLLVVIGFLLFGLLKKR